MKIVCSKEEFAALVRECYRSATVESCKGCLFSSVCTAGYDILNDDHVMTRIEDICEIEVGDRG